MKKYRNLQNKPKMIPLPGGGLSVRPYGVFEVDDNVVLDYMVKSGAIVQLVSDKKKQDVIDDCKNMDAKQELIGREENKTDEKDKDNEKDNGKDNENVGDINDNMEDVDMCDMGMDSIRDATEDNGNTIENGNLLTDSTDVLKLDNGINESDSERKKTRKRRKKNKNKENSIL